MADFYGIDLRGRIIVPSKTGPTQTYELWTSDTNQLTQLGLYGLTDLSYVQDITITIGLSLNSKVSLTLTPPLDVGLHILHSPLINWAGSMLEIDIGYSTGGDGLTGGNNANGSNLAPQKFSGLIMKPEVRIGSDVSITLNALGVAYGMNLSNATDAKTFPAGTSPWEAVKQTFLELGYNSVNNEDIVFPDTPANRRINGSPVGNEPADMFFQPVTKVNASNASQADAVSGAGSSSLTGAEPILRGPRNSWWFIRELIKNYGLELFIRDQQVFIRDPQIWKTQQPQFTFVLRGGIDTAVNSINRVYPILEYNSPSAYIWLAPGSGGLVQSGVEMNTVTEVHKVATDDRKAIQAVPSFQLNTAAKSSSFITNLNTSATVNSQLSSNQNVGQSSWVGGVTGPPSTAPQRIDTSSSKTGTTRTDAGTVNTVNGNPSGGGGFDAAQSLPGNPDDVNSQLHKAEYLNYDHNRGIQAEITTIGIPELLPAMVVTVAGMSPDTNSQSQSWFDGNYGILVVEHSIGTSGMSTKFKGLKNFTPDNMLIGTAGTGIVNTQSPANNGTTSITVPSQTQN
jgi:hypothetical protein